MLLQTREKRMRFKYSVFGIPARLHSSRHGTHEVSYDKRHNSRVLQDVSIKVTVWYTLQAGLSSDFVHVINIQKLGPYP